MAEWRIAALAQSCEYCSAAPATPCTDPRTGYVLQSQAAHLVRLRLAGFGQLGQLWPDPQPAPTLDDLPPEPDDLEDRDHDYFRR